MIEESGRFRSSPMLDSGLAHLLLLLLLVRSSNSGSSDTGEGSADVEAEELEVDAIVGGESERAMLRSDAAILIRMSCEAEMSSLSEYLSHVFHAPRAINFNVTFFSVANLIWPSQSQRWRADKARSWYRR
jgi:hypothetical protein